MLQIIHQFKMAATTKFKKLIALEQTDTSSLEVVTRDSKSKTTKSEQLKVMVPIVTGLSVITTKSTISMFKQITKSEILRVQVLTLNGQSEMATHYLYKIIKSEPFQALVLMLIGLLEMETVNPLKNSTFKVVATKSVALLAQVQMLNGQLEMAIKDYSYKVQTLEAIHPSHQPVQVH